MHLRHFHFLIVFDRIEIVDHGFLSYNLVYNISAIQFSFIMQLFLKPNL